jgi:hypothetical protein
MDRILWIGFLNDIFYDRSHIAGPGELSIAFLLDKNPTVVPVGSGGLRWQAGFRLSDCLE